MNIDGKNIKNVFIKASYIKRKNSSNTSIDVYGEYTFISFWIMDEFDPRNMKINDTINLVKHVYWDISLENESKIYDFDIYKDKVELTRLSEDDYRLKVHVENPDMFYTIPEGLEPFKSLDINTTFSFVYEDIKCMLTSTMDLSYYDEENNKLPQKFDNKNKKLDTIKKYVKKYDNFVFVASVEDNYEITDLYANVAIESFKMTLPFKNYYVLDGRTKDKAEEYIKNADLIYLCGGHVPTQNSFFKNINLRKLIRKTNAFIIGASAGSMNMAERVYAPPEYEEEVNIKYKRYYQGLGLTHLNIFPHYDEMKDATLKNINVINQMVLPDSYKHDLYALNNGAYILISDNVYLYGEIYLLRDGKIKQICKDNESKVNKEWRFL